MILLYIKSGINCLINMTKCNAPFSRILIDRMLEKSEWDLTDSHQARFEFSGSSGRADYLLMGHLRLP
jgi:predicted type IV restriction endonuclease